MKQVMIELTILGIVIMTVSIFLIVFLGSDYYDNDIQIHDLSIGPWIFNFWIVTPIILIAFFIRAHSQKYKNQSSNFIMLTAAILSLLIFIQLFSWYSELSDLVQ